MALTVYTHTAGEAGLSVNAYLLEGEQAVVAIDTSLGLGESHADGYFDVRAEGEHGAVAFIGDVAFHGTHSYLSDGHTAAWLANVARLSADLVDAGRLYPGHGAPGGVELFDAQRAYLDAYRTAVRELAGGRPTMTEDAKVELARRMTRLRPDAPLGWLLPLGADPVAAELAAEASIAS